jgi:hypothetical protein
MPCRVDEMERGACYVAFTLTVAGYVPRHPKFAVAAAGLGSRSASRELRYFAKESAKKICVGACISIFSVDLNLRI